VRLRCIRRWRHRSVLHHSACVYIYNPCGMGWKKWPLRFQIDGRDGAGARQGEDRGERLSTTTPELRSTRIQFSLRFLFSQLFFSPIYFSLSPIPFKTWPPPSADFQLRQLISSSVIQPPLVSLPFSLLTLSVFGWWPVLEAVPKAAFLHLLLSRLRSVVDYCCFHFLAPPSHLFRIVQNNNNNSKEIKKKEL